jgi:FAD/FMN-containing dehydrogenase
MQRLRLIRNVAPETAAAGVNTMDLSRRDVLRVGALTAGLVAVGGLPAWAAQPTAFPADIPVSLPNFENWCGAINVPGLWTARPRSAHDVVRIVNWAHHHHWTVRPKGAMHGWSPLTVANGTPEKAPIMLVDTQNLHAVSLTRHPHPHVRVGAGVRMLGLLSFLEAHGLGLTSVPATGDPTIAGALAIGGHGAALPGRGERHLEGHTFGSLPNLVISLTAVVWDDRRGRYALRTLHRDEKDIGAFLVHLGRAFVTDVTLRTGANPQLRCISRTDVTIDELFAKPGSGGRTFESFLERAGRVEAIWFPFTEKPWLKFWSVAATKPAASRRTDAPYNYPFSDLIPQAAATAAARTVKDTPSSTPAFGQAEYAASVAGLAALDAADLWGSSKNTMLYIRATTLRLNESGYGIACRRVDIQRVLHLFIEKYRNLQATYQAAGNYPMNGPVEVRACGIDRLADVGITGAQPAALGATSPRVDHPEWNAVVWLNLLTFPGTAGSYRFYREMEQWTIATFDGTWAAARPEWSKGWAFSDTAAWGDAAMLRHTLPALVSAGKPTDGDFRWAMRRLDAHDPHRVFSNGFLDRLASGPERARLGLAGDVAPLP